MGWGWGEEQRRWNSIFSLTSSTNSGFIAFMFIFFILFVALSSANPLSVSEQSLQSQLSIGRSLLQAQQGCSVNFEGMNYTIITSRCKGPRYPAKACCDAFKDFACPYSDQVNDVQSNCATTMFSYINLYGKYPPGLFANECQDSKRGLECTEAQSNPPTSSANPHNHLPLFPLLALTSLPILCHLNLH